MKTKKSYHPVDLYVGNRLRSLRLERSMSQDELAKAVDLTFQQIQKYERGQNRISASKLYEFANFLKVSIDFFFQGFANPNESYVSSTKKFHLNLCDMSDDYDNPVSSKELEELAKHFASVDDLSVRKSMLKIIESIASEYNSSYIKPKKNPKQN